MRLQQLAKSNLNVAASLAVVCVFIAALTSFFREDVETVPAVASEQHDAESDGSSFGSSSQSDLTSMLQAASIHVEFVGEPRTNDNGGPHKASQHATDFDDMSLFSGAPIKALEKKKTPMVAPVGSSKSAELYSKAAAALISSASLARGALSDAVQSRLFTSSTAGLAIAMLVLLIACTCAAAISIVCPQRFSLREHRGIPIPDEQAIPVTIHDQCLSSMSANLAPFSQLASPGQRQRGPGWGQGLSPFANALTPMMSVDQVPAHATVDDLAHPDPEVRTFAGLQDAPRPPPLCPTLVMPVCEARFGIPMFELAHLNNEGELNIVGLSGNPLLRAVIRQIGLARTLEISMPEPNSAPRAVISPSSNELAGNGQVGSRALEIRGMRGAFYGFLEMRSSGACYVVKDGQTVLTIDGDAESLQLSIKSSVGLQLASVRCSAEPFDGVDHVEIRVEPAVDTVLVLSVVLAVLLLSPYLPPSDD